MSVSLAGLTLPAPVLVASGCGGTGRELAAYAELARLGGFVTRTITLDPRPGSPLRRVEESPAGLVHAGGLQNPGIDGFLATELPWLVQQGARVFVSIAGHTLGEYAALAGRLGRSPGVAAIEVNLGDPTADGLFDVREPFHAASVLSACRRDLPRGLPVLAKIRTEAGRVVEMARALAEAGAEGLVLGHALPALTSDGRPAGLSGPAVRPLALRCVADVHDALPDLPLVGAGGVRTAQDVRAFLAAGATAVQVGAALLHDPTTATRIIDDLDRNLEGAPA